MLDAEIPPEARVFLCEYSLSCDKRESEPTAAAPTRACCQQTDPAEMGACAWVCPGDSRPAESPFLPRKTPSPSAPTLVSNPSQTWLLVCRDAGAKRGCRLDRVGMGVARRSSEAKVQPLDKGVTSGPPAIRC